MLKKLLNDLILNYHVYKNISVYNSIVKKKIDILKKNNSFIESKAYSNSLVKKYKLNDISSKNYFDFYYSVSRIDSCKYIPEPIYLLFFEKILNNREYSAVLSDKNYYDENGLDIRTPKTIIRKINDHFYDQSFKRIELNQDYLLSCLGKDRVVLKASLYNSSGGGKNIEFFHKVKNNFINTLTHKILTISYLKSLPDFIMQEVVDQYVFYRNFNPDSNNTIRILTYRSVINDTTKILHRLLRVGKKGSYMDHDNLGGSVIGINSDGRFNSFCTDSNGLTSNVYNSILLSNLGTAPYLNKLEKEAIKIAKKQRYVRLLAIDFTVDDTGTPILLEINSIGNGVGQYQMNNGPLFGDYTDEILDHSISKIKNFKVKLIIQ